MYPKVSKKAFIKPRSLFWGHFTGVYSHSLQLSPALSSSLSLSLSLSLSFSLESSSLFHQMYTAYFSFIYIIVSVSSLCA